jgi:hypothetical protein
LLADVRIIGSARGGLTGDIVFGSAENEDTRQQSGGVDDGTVEKGLVCWKK